LMRLGGWLLMLLAAVLLAVGLTLYLLQ